MFIPHPGSDFFLSRIPDPNCLHPGSRILIKKFKYLTPKKAKKWFPSSKKYDPGCSSRIPDPDTDFLPSRISGSKKHPIPDPGSGSATLQLDMPRLLLTSCYAMLGIRDILVRIRIPGSIPLTNGSGFGCGSRSCYSVTFWF
jgi:hypothetical protein